MYHNIQSTYLCVHVVTVRIIFRLLIIVHPPLQKRNTVNYYIFFSDRDKGAKVWERMQFVTSLSEDFAMSPSVYLAV